MVEEKTLTSLPLEVRYVSLIEFTCEPTLIRYLIHRHTIFEYAAIRDFMPRELLRYWFEKKELKALIAKQAAADPDGPAPRVVYDRYHDVDSDVTESEHGDEEAGSEGDEAQEDEENEEPDDEDEEAEQEDGEDDAEVDDEEQAENPSAEEVQDEESEDAMEEDQDTEGSEVVQPSATDPSPIQSHLHDVIEQEQTDETEMQVELEGGEEHEDAEIAQAEPAGAAVQETQDNVDEDGDEAMDGDGDEEAAGGADTTTPSAPPLPPPAPVIRAAPKWRHIPKFMRVTHCPPPAELLLTSKQLHDEVNNWFYDVAVLRIEATASFAHTSFFEEAFSQITEAAFSPMENIRKVEVTFVWDTTWIRAEESSFAANIFPALLRQRSDFVLKILSQAPDLKEVTVHWHDSAQDDESANFMLEILAAFHSLPATVKIEEHYIAIDAKPRKRSIAGKQRVEFQSIMDNGIDLLL